jgi:hypothetical protein
VDTESKIKTLPRVSKAFQRSCKSTAAWTHFRAVIEGPDWNFYNRHIQQGLLDRPLFATLQSIVVWDVQPGLLDHLDTLMENRLHSLCTNVENRFLQWLLDLPSDRFARFRTLGFVTANSGEAVDPNLFTRVIQRLMREGTSLERLECLDEGLLLTDDLPLPAPEDYELAIPWASPSFTHFRGDLFPRCVALALPSHITELSVCAFDFDSYDLGTLFLRQSSRLQRLTVRFMEDYDHNARLGLFSTTYLSSALLELKLDLPPGQLFDMNDFLENLPFVCPNLRSLMISGGQSQFEPENLSVFLSKLGMPRMEIIDLGAWEWTPEHLLEFCQCCRLAGPQLQRVSLDRPDSDDAPWDALVPLTSIVCQLFAKGVDVYIGSEGSHTLDFFESHISPFLPPFSPRT